MPSLARLPPRNIPCPHRCGEKFRYNHERDHHHKSCNSRQNRSNPLPTAGDLRASIGYDQPVGSQLVDTPASERRTASYASAFGGEVARNEEEDTTEATANVAQKKATSSPEEPVPTSTASATPEPVANTSAESSSSSPSSSSCGYIDAEYLTTQVDDLAVTGEDGTAEATGNGVTKKDTDAYKVEETRSANAPSNGVTQGGDDVQNEEDMTKSTCTIKRTLIAQSQREIGVRMGASVVQERDAIRTHVNYAFEEGIDRGRIEWYGRASMPLINYPNEGRMRIVRATWEQTNEKRRVRNNGQSQ